MEQLDRREGGMAHKTFFLFLSLVVALPLLTAWEGPSDSNFEYYGPPMDGEITFGGRIRTAICTDVPVFMLDTSGAAIGVGLAGVDRSQLGFYVDLIRPLRSGEQVTVFSEECKVNDVFTVLPHTSLPVIYFLPPTHESKHIAGRVIGCGNRPFIWAFRGKGVGGIVWGVSTIDETGAFDIHLSIPPVEGMQLTLVANCSSGFVRDYPITLAALPTLTPQPTTTITPTATSTITPSLTVTPIATPTATVSITPYGRFRVWLASIDVP